MERARLRRVFEQKLDTVVGYVLPVAVANGPRLAGPTWVTGPWFFRDERMYLMPGDSPMGYRLPLDSLPWASKADYPYMVEQDPSAPREALAPAGSYFARYSGLAGAPTGAPAGGAGQVPAAGTPPYVPGPAPDPKPPAACRLAWVCRVPPAMCRPMPNR